MNRTTESDLYRYRGTTSLMKGMIYPGFRYMYFLRKAARRKKYSFLGILYRLIIKRLSYKFGYQIPVYTSIGEGFYIGHFGTVVINENAIIGKNCNIAHSTTIGQASRGKLKGSPTIGDHVWIGTGSVIVGNIHIASHVLIAPNSFVNMDIPENSLVIGNPAKIIKRENPTEGYINNVLYPVKSPEN
jgi:serine O-acetyltransferase